MNSDLLGVFTPYSRTFNINYMTLKLLIYASSHACGTLTKDIINYRYLPVMHYIMAEDDLNIASLTGNLDSDLAWLLKG